jgi:hypothetical protein
LLKQPVRLPPQQEHRNNDQRRNSAKDQAVFDSGSASVVPSEPREPRHSSIWPAKRDFRQLEFVQATRFWPTFTDIAHSVAWVDSVAWVLACVVAFVAIDTFRIVGPRENRRKF